MALTGDPGAEDFVWPEVKDLKPAEAMKLLDEIEREATMANKRADRLKSRKATAKNIATTVLEIYGLDEAAFTNDEGKRIKYTPYPFDAFSLDNEEEFRKWAEGQHERYYDKEPKLREGVFRDEMRRRLADGEPLPPGVRRYTDVRLSRTAKAVGKRPKKR